MDLISNIFSRRDKKQKLLKSSIFMPDIFFAQGFTLVIGKEEKRLYLVNNEAFVKQGS